MRAFHLEGSRRLREHGTDLDVPLLLVEHLHASSRRTSRCAQAAAESCADYGRHLPRRPVAHRHSVRRLDGNRAPHRPSRRAKGSAQLLWRGGGGGGPPPAGTPPPHTPPPATRSF